MRFFHRTSLENAVRIVNGGFRDAKIPEWQAELSDISDGVWIADRVPSSSNITGNHLVVFDLDQVEIEAYSFADKHYSLSILGWFVPAATLNASMQAAKVMTVEQADAEFGNSAANTQPEGSERA